METLVSQVVALAVFATLAAAVKVDRTPMLMPGVAPKRPDTYLCYAMKLNANINQNIVGFLPNVSHAVHHMLLYGCPEPGSQERVWNCGGEMAHVQHHHGGDHSAPDNEEPVEELSPVCQSDEKILYAWAHNAPNFELPEGVGFEVGGDTPLQYLVVQLHYGHVEDLDKIFPTLDGCKLMYAGFVRCCHVKLDYHPGITEANCGFAFFGTDGKKDHSGLTLLHTMDELPRQAGVIVMMANGRIPAKHQETVDIACPLVEYSELHPFAYRAHTHKLGTVVSGYAIQDGKWELLGKRDPNTPQMFYPVANDKVVISAGDTLAARCTMNNPNDYAVNMGSTMNDEMCNFYLMYWTEKPFAPIEQDSCLSLGPPYVYWKTFGLRDEPADSTTL